MKEYSEGEKSAILDFLHYCMKEGLITKKKFTLLKDVLLPEKASVIRNIAESFVDLITITFTISPLVTFGCFFLGIAISVILFYITNEERKKEKKEMEVWQWVIVILPPLLPLLSIFTGTSFFTIIFLILLLIGIVFICAIVGFVGLIGYGIGQAAYAPGGKCQIL